jgi:hypothetical protein
MVKIVTFMHRSISTDPRTSMDKIPLILAQLRAERQRINTWLDGIEAEVSSMLPPGAKPGEGDDLDRSLELLRSRAKSHKSKSRLKRRRVSTPARANRVVDTTPSRLGN